MTLDFKTGFVLFLGAASAGLTQAGTVEPWRNPDVFRVNKEPAHAEFIVYADRESAIAPLELSSPWSGECYQSLNGKWDFNWYKTLEDVPADWCLPESSVEMWNPIPVPGTWQNSGFDRLYYLNHPMPFMYTENVAGLRKEFKKTAVRPCLESGFIPDDAQRVGCYRRWVELSEERLENRVVLRVGAVEAGFHVFVNGVDVGYSQDSFTPAEFEISNYLKPGKNLIALKVYRWTDGSYLEIQDMVRFAGIYRDVFLRFEPKRRIEDLYFIGTPSTDLKTVNAVYKVDVENAPEGATVEFELISNSDGRTVQRWTKPVSEASAIQGSQSFGGLKLWSPDRPNLYTLLVTLKDAGGKAVQVVRIDAGFRRFEQIDGNFFLNGQRYFIKGVNRHDHHAQYGKVVPLETMIRDLELMKKANINTVRTAHYPNDERWYYLCNRYGMALIDEANVETHGLSDIPGDIPRWHPAAVDRVENMVQRDKNHPSILIWSLGNEQGWGWNDAFDKQYDRAKEIDKSRLVMCDRGNRLVDSKDGKSFPVRLDKPDTVSPMYGTESAINKYLKNRRKDQRPFFMCEYRHAMGNAVGSLKEVWDMVYANENNGVNGGCIWDWADQGVEATQPDGTTYYQYGGDWGDLTSRKNFSLNGLVLPDQGETPKLAEVKKCYEPLFVTAVSLEKGVFEIYNRYNQLDVTPFALEWQLLENGEKVQSGRLDSLTATPGEKQTVTIPYQTTKLNPNKEYYIRLGFVKKDDSIWAPAGHEITFSEFKLSGGFEVAKSTAREDVRTKREGGSVQVSIGDTLSASFDETSGLLTSLRVRGDEMLIHTDRDQLFDHSAAWIDNYFRKDKPRLTEFFKLKLNQLDRKGTADVSVSEDGRGVVVTIKNSFLSPKNAGFDEVQTWAFDSAGHIHVSESVTPVGLPNTDVWIPRIGLRIPLKPALEHVSYYGLGPHGNYPDRATGAWTAVHSGTVMEHYIPYPKPQDHGNREQVRWMSLTDAAGNGLKIIAPEPLSMSALPYAQDELLNATHTIDLPKTPTTTELRIAAGVSGVGNGSCGPPTEKKYRATAQPTEYRFIISPVFQ